MNEYVLLSVATEFVELKEQWPGATPFSSMFGWIEQAIDK